MGYPTSFEQFVVYEPWNPEEYRELRLIAKAIHGAVHLAEHLPTGELRAIKKIPNHNVYKRPDGQLENALVEIGASLYLSHHAVAAVSGIIQTHGAFRDKTDTYLVTEFAAGGELFDEVARVGHINEEQAKRIGLQLLLAVKSLHDNGVCHRDLSLENTLIHADGSIRVIDFGQAEPLFDNAGCEKYLVNAAGKLYYRAPEMYSGAYRGTAADMFAAGVELFILVFGTPPWLQATPTDDRFVFIQNYPDGFERLLARWKRRHFVSKEFRGLIEQMIQAEPSKRPSADEALAHPSLTRCDPALDFTFLSCSTWFLPATERGPSLENEVDFSHSAVPRSKSASRNYSSEDACLEQVKRTNRGLGQRSRSSIQQVEYCSDTEDRLHHSEGCSASHENFPGANFAEWQDTLGEHVALTQKQLSPGHKLKFMEDEGDSSSDRTPRCERTPSSMSQNAYMKLASPLLGNSSCGGRIDFPAVSSIVGKSISYTFKMGQPVSTTPGGNYMQMSPRNQRVEFGTRLTNIQPTSFSPYSSSVSSLSVSAGTANFPARESAVPIKEASLTCMPASTSVNLSTPVLQTPPTKPFQRCTARNNKGEHTSADVSAASDIFTQKEVDILGQDRVKLERDMQAYGIRRRTGDGRGQSKQGRSSAWKNKGVGKKSRTPNVKTRRGESRTMEASSPLPTASTDIWSSEEGREKKEVSGVSASPITKGVAAVLAHRGALGVGSLRRGNSEVTDPAGPTFTSGFSVGASSGADYATADATANAMANASTKRSVPARAEKTATAASDEEKKTFLQNAAMSRAGGTGADVKASPCSSAKLSPASGSPFSLRLRALSLMLANRLTGFKFCRGSNQEQPAAKRKGNVARTDGHA